MPIVPDNDDDDDDDDDVDKNYDSYNDDDVIDDNNDDNVDDDNNKTDGDNDDYDYLYIDLLLVTIPCGRKVDMVYTSLTMTLVSRACLVVTD